MLPDLKNFTLKKENTPPHPNFIATPFFLDINLKNIIEKYDVNKQFLSLKSRFQLKQLFQQLNIEEQFLDYTLQNKVIPIYDYLQEKTFTSLEQSKIRIARIQQIETWVQQQQTLSISQYLQVSYIPLYNLLLLIPYCKEKNINYNHNQFPAHVLIRILGIHSQNPYLLQQNDPNNNPNPNPNPNNNPNPNPKL